MVYENKCPECGGRIVQNDSEEHCIKCGLVIDENIDFSGFEANVSCCLPTLWVE